MAHPHLTLNPVIINLSEIPLEGRQYTYTHESAELTPSLKEIIGKKPFRVEIQVVPAGNVFQAQGKIETGYDEVCSLCALEFVQPIQEKFNEILVIQKPMMKGHQVRVNHSSELNLDGPECIELENEFFHVGDYVREMIALAQPIKPLGKPNCDQTCENYQEAVRKGWLTPQKDEAFKPESPFSSLAKVKLNS